MGRYKSGQRFDVDRMRALLYQGHTVPQIAEAMKVTPRTVSRHKRSQGLTQPATTRTLPDGWDQKASQLFDEGYSQDSVAELTGVSCDTLARYFPGRGWTASQKGKYAAEVRRLNQLHNFAQPDRQHRHEQEQEQQ